jgi:hypothetical protein
MAVYQVTLRLPDGTEHTLPTTHDQHLLDAALEAGRA